MELKLSIEMQQALGEKVDYAKENSCCICMTDLYEGIQEMTIDQVKDVQRKIIDEMTKNPLKDDTIPVVKLGKCSGMHFYHKECLQSQLDNTTSKDHLKCAACSIVYGKQTGEMPPGSMRWFIVGQSCPGYEGHSTIQVDYNIPSGMKENTRY